MENEYSDVNASRYAGSGSMLGGTASDQAERPLERIAIAADRIQRLTRLVSEFQDRFHHGAAPQTTAMVGVKENRPPYSPGHAGSLARLFDNLDELESVAHRLGEIG